MVMSSDRCHSPRTIVLINEKKYCRSVCGVVIIVLPRRCLSVLYWYETHAALVMIDCLSAAIMQRLTEADGPHMRGDGPESACGMVSLCKVQWVKCATRLMTGTESDATENPQGQSSGTAPIIPLLSPRHCVSDDQSWKVRTKPTFPGVTSHPSAGVASLSIAVI